MRPLKQRQIIRTHVLLLEEMESFDYISRNASGQLSNDPFLLLLCQTETFMVALLRSGNGDGDIHSASAEEVATDNKPG